MPQQNKPFSLIHRCQSRSLHQSQKLLSEHLPPLASSPTGAAPLATPPLPRASSPTTRGILAAITIRAVAAIRPAHSLSLINGIRPHEIRRIGYALDHIFEEVELISSDDRSLAMKWTIFRLSRIL